MANLKRRGNENMRLAQLGWERREIQVPSATMPTELTLTLNSEL